MAGVKVNSSGLRLHRRLEVGECLHVERRETLWRALMVNLPPVLKETGIHLKLENSARASTVNKLRITQRAHGVDNRRKRPSCRSGLPLSFHTAVPTGLLQTRI